MTLDRAFPPSSLSRFFKEIRDMITALQNFFLRHNKWLFGSLLVVIIVTFVLTIGPQSFFGSSSGPQTTRLDYFGYNLSSPADQQAISSTAEISAILNPNLGMRRNQLMEYAYMRVAALGIGSQLGIPGPSDSEMEAFVKSLPIFQDPATGEFSPESYQRILNQLNEGSRFTEAQLARVIREDYVIEKVRDALGGPSYILPHEARQTFLARKTTYDIATAFFNYTSFNPEIAPTEDELHAFYDQNPAQYEVPEKIKVTALVFEGAAYVDEVDEPSEETLRNHFLANKAAYQPKEPPLPDEAAEAETAPEITFEEARDEVRADVIRREARTVAGRKAEAFSLALWQRETVHNSPEFRQLLEDFKVQTIAVEPYPRDRPPSMADVPRQILESMWIYSSGKRYFSDIGTTGNGAVVAVFEAIEPGYLPPFEEVRGQVLSNFREGEKRRLFQERGETIASMIRDAVKNGTPFAEIATELDLEVMDHEPFTGEQPLPELRISRAWQQFQHLPAGSLSPMVTNQDQGEFLFVQNRDEPEIDTDSGEYLEFVESQNAMMVDAIGWSRLRELTDTTLASLFPESEPIQ